MESRIKSWIALLLVMMATSHCEIFVENRGNLEFEFKKFKKPNLLNFTLEFQGLDCFSLKASQ